MPIVDTGIFIVKTVDFSIPKAITFSARLFTPVNFNEFPLLTPLAIRLR